MRWIFGKNYDPFATTKKEGLHPLPAFMKYHQNKIRNFYFGFIYIIPTISVAFILNLIQKFVFRQFYWNKTTR